MLKIENVVLPSPEQWTAVIRGMRNPKNSWDYSDSETIYICDEETGERANFEFLMGEKDEELCKKLAYAGSVHGKFLRMIPVYLDITAPLYWWKEFDTYKVGTVANSCSTMHKIAEKEFKAEDFSLEKIGTLSVMTVTKVIEDLNIWRIAFKSYDALDDKFKSRYSQKDCWYNMIQLLPSSYNQKRTVMLNYEVLRNIYQYRHDHKLDEWHTFCDWILTLPHYEFIVGEEVAGVLEAKLKKEGN